MVNDAAAAKAMSSASERVVEKSSSEDELFVTPNGKDERERETELTVRVGERKDSNADR